MLKGYIMKKKIMILIGILIVILLAIILIQVNVKVKKIIQPYRAQEEIQIEIQGIIEETKQQIQENENREATLQDLKTVMQNKGYELNDVEGKVEYKGYLVQIDESLNILQIEKIIKISYQITARKDVETLGIFLIAEDKECEISKIECPNENTVYFKNKNKIAIDYDIKFGTDYKFIVTNKNGDTKELIINEDKPERLYLYKAGDQCTSVTGGYKVNILQNTSTTHAFNSNNIYLKAQSIYGVGYGEIELYANKTVDVTKYLNIYFDMDYHVGFGQSDWRTKLYYGLNGKMQTVSGTNNSRGKTIPMNIGYLLGEQRVYFKLYSASSESYTDLRIRNIYIE